MMGGEGQDNIAAPIKSIVLEQGSVEETTHISVESVVKSLQRDINILIEPANAADRQGKRRALEHIHKTTTHPSSLLLQGKGNHPSSDEFVWTGVEFASLLKVLLPPLLRVFEDPIERCREGAVALVATFIPVVQPDMTPFLSYLIPVLSNRLAQVETVEVSEEIRLALVRLLHSLILQSPGVGFSPFVEESIRILYKTLADPFPEVKKLSCTVVSLLAVQHPKPLAYHGKEVALAFIPLMLHRHSAVRIAALSALGAAINVEASGFDDCLPALRQCALDKAPSVREALYRTAGLWSMHLPDRYSFGYKFLPLLYAGLGDEREDLRTLSSQLMLNAGILYEQEWETRVKDELDYTGDDSDRPRVGCRHLARDNTQKIIAQTAEGIADWNKDLRLLSLRVLTQFLPFVEDQVTGYSNAILPALCKVLMGDEIPVMDAAQVACEQFGKFVKADIFLSLLIPSLKAAATSAKVGALRALTFILKSYPSQDFHSIATALIDPELVFNENVTVLLQLVRLVDVCTKTVNAETVQNENIFHYFTVLVTLQSHLDRKQYSCDALAAALVGKAIQFTKEEEEIGAVVQTVLTRISDVLGMPSPAQLYATWCDRLSAQVCANIREWTRHTPNLWILLSALFQCEGELSTCLNVALPLLAALCDPVYNFEVRQEVLAWLPRLLAQLQDPDSIHMTPYAELILTRCILPNGIWRSGRKSAVLRDLSMALFAVSMSWMEVDVLVKEDRLDVHVLPVLISCMEEDEASTRRSVLKVTHHLLQKLSVLKASHYKSIYPELLKRLDDAQDDIRIQVSAVLASFFTSVSSWLNRMKAEYPSESGQSTMAVDGVTLVELRLDDVHWQTMLEAICIHLDDSQLAVQEAVYECLCTGTLAIPGPLFVQHLTTIRPRHRSTTYIDRLLAKLQISG